MIPNNALSSTAVVSGYPDPVKTPADMLVDWERGGIYLNDPSMGMLVKVWEVRAVKNDETLDFDVIISAPGGVSPGEVSRTLFSRPEITEVSLGFDQNMNPFVAFVENGVARYWWYDSSQSGMRFDDLPSGARSPRATMDDKRDFNIGASDNILSYVLGSNLCARYQRDRYQQEYVLGFVGSSATIISMSMNTGNRLQFRLRNADVVPGDTRYKLAANPFLADIVQNLLERSGVDRKDIDVSDLYTETLGYKCASQAGADIYIQPLRQAFFFDVSEYDKKIRFPMRGGPAVAQVDIDDMLDDHGNSPLHMERVQEAELLRKVSVISIDPAAGYAAMTQSAERRSNTVMATSEATTEVPITMSSDEAATVASKRIKIAWGELHKADFRLGVPWTSLTPADVIEVTDKRGARYRMRVVSVSEDTGQIEIEAIEDADFAYRSSASGITPAPPRSTTPGLVGDTTPIPMNLPSLRTSDNVPGIYVATVGGGTGWTGAEFWLSADDGQTYSPIGGVDIGSAVGTLDAAITDTTDPFGVTLAQGELFNATPEQLAARQNAFAILTGGVAEIAQFANATEGAPLQYELDTITRGLLDTTAAPHDAGDRFVLLDDSVVFLPIDQSFSGRTLLIKAVSFGQSTDEATPVPFVYNPKTGPIPGPPQSVQLIADNTSPPVFLTNEAEDDFIYSD